MPIIIGLLAFSGLVIGGLFSYLFWKVNRSNIYGLHVFCGGLLIGLLLFDIIPETFHHQNSTRALIGIVLGLICMICLEHVFPHEHDKKGIRSNTYSFFFLVVAIFAHNIPTGFAWGSTLTTSDYEQTSLLVAIFLHHIPEGVALMIPCLFIRRGIFLYISGIVLLSSLLSMSTWLGSHIATENDYVQSVMMGLAIGGIGYITIHEMLWKVRKQMSTPVFTLYFLLGLLFIIIYSKIGGQH
jgi:zinc transporter, ZIP family